MTPKDYLGNIPKVGDIIAVIHNTSTRHSELTRASVTGFKETPKQIKMFIKPIDTKYLYRNYLILLDNQNNNQFIIINIY